MGSTGRTQSRVGRINSFNHAPKHIHAATNLACKGSREAWKRSEAEERRDRGKREGIIGPRSARVNNGHSIDHENRNRRAQPRRRPITGSLNARSITIVHNDISTHAHTRTSTRALARPRRRRRRAASAAPRRRAAPRRAGGPWPYRGTDSPPPTAAGALCEHAFLPSLHEYITL